MSKKLQSLVTVIVTVQHFLFTLCIFFFITVNKQYTGSIYSKVNCIQTAYCCMQCFGFLNVTDSKK